MNPNPNKDDRLHEIDDDRLIDAADAILEVEARSPDGLGTMVAGAPKAGQFTPQELVEAMGFLIRLGLVVPDERGLDRARQAKHKKP